MVILKEEKLSLLKVPVFQPLSLLNYMDKNVQTFKKLLPELNIHAQPAHTLMPINKESLMEKIMPLKLLLKPTDNKLSLTNMLFSDIVTYGQRIVLGEEKTHQVKEIQLSLETKTLFVLIKMLLTQFTYYKLLTVLPSLGEIMLIWFIMVSSFSLTTVTSL